MPFYPVYALLFADSGVSPAGISALFALWSVTTFLLEIPSGVWADLVSRRRLVVLSPLLEAAGYALWVAFGSFWVFAAGFVLLGAGNALRSGALQALVYTELRRMGATDSYPRLIGRYQAIDGLATLAAAALAAPLMAAGGYRAVAAASVAALLGCAAAGLLLPDSSGRDADGEDSEPSPDDADELRAFDVLRAAVGVVRRSAPVRRALGLLAALTAVAALDEYIPLLAQGTGAPPAAVPLLVMVVYAGGAVGGLLTGRGGGLLTPALAAAALLLGVGAASGHPVGVVAVGAAFGVFYWALARADAALQDQLDDATRATVSSMAGTGMEAVAVATFAAYATGSLWLAPSWLFTLVAVPYLLLALAATLRRRQGGNP
ncbi:MFS transporter [Frankia sp. CNm7]|uniref:MFS transporter n=1 Tax=Frankia nepalensis TaxID=1836974 RepID=A0A937UNQ2_9ACTN|nr:MFS transporter [Frankia nepalensis]MBL7499898.1 MFS transporter [Frankia nepalensis]MBL7512284.1 MFS transporter [Frankia nepalensis]MBL7521066.1 MFS transporter [Frankia nepalensis]MBL7628318.1 MFS transporter [Frankia nepalensis]